jgi:hypothetical protein
MHSQGCKCHRRDLENDLNPLFSLFKRASTFEDEQETIHPIYNFTVRMPHYQAKIMEVKLLSTTRQDLNQLGFKWTLPGFKPTPEDIRELAELIVDLYFLQNPETPPAHSTDVPTTP